MLVRDHHLVRADVLHSVLAFFHVADPLPSFKMGVSCGRCVAGSLGQLL